MIDAGDILILRDRRCGARPPIVDTRLVRIRRRHELVEELAREWSDAGGWNHVAGERLFRDRIENRRRNAREIAGPQHGGGKQGWPAQRPWNLASGFPVEDEEGLVLPPVDARE